MSVKRKYKIVAEFVLNMVPFLFKSRQNMSASYTFFCFLDHDL